ncbi:fumarate reductase flavoprotein subunit|uniref:Fumarate reductase flavoprotein subunit n=1 Tax=Brenneria salicis ATCC 15712 = DSM 30166 TaxID=714314 RepID=A0A366HZG4_9GAMM|nr:flavocytochrome c [Brenneria salicis]NMN91262.1 fumarate reductase flavoprotein subunit [Brenneria salicis ATCC 15712 = DSM 30166]RBP58118.1 fumarate reductase flavoprotein subunit [Brenneria salicis ATCC 15712 = DSM 30166]RLM29090.1 flavocytochrome c [Brenneria salicis ATCC 15712 = DSM 30166]
MKKKVLLLSALAFAFSSAAHSEMTDIVIIGAGGAGMSAAIEAHNQGAKVILLEKMAFAGGNTARAEAGLNAAGTDLQKARGITDSPEMFYEDTMKGGRNINNPDVVKTLTEHAKDSVVFLKENGADLADLTRTGGSRVDRTHRPAGGVAAGSFIATALIKKVKTLDIDLRTNTSATDILKNDKGEVTGVKATGKDGKTFTIDAKKVMITSGGFGANFDMIKQYDPKLVGFKTTNAPGSLGEGIKMATKLNAKLVDMEYIQIHPSTVPGKGILITEAVRGDGAIMINESGKRFVNELLTRDVVSQSILKQPGAHAYLIFNDELVNQNQATKSYFKQKLVAQGDTPEALAKAINVDGKQLTQTINTYSAAVKAKKDSEFDRDSMKLALDSGKYYAIEITPGIHHTMGGIAINNKAQVLDVNGNVIPNLFAAGEAAGGVHGANRLGGNSLADIVTYGRIGAAEAVKEIKAGQ